MKTLNSLLHHLKISILFLLIMSIVTGLLYPGFITLFARIFFKEKSYGSLIYSDQNQLQGSLLIGQLFEDPKYFWGRPSATTPYPYNATASNGSNLGPSNPALIEAVQKRIANLRVSNPLTNAAIPIELLQASGSGLDPHISMAAAKYQIARVAKTRSISEADLNKLIDECTQNPDLGFLGSKRINVLLLNLSLDKFQAASNKQQELPDKSRSR